MYIPSKNYPTRRLQNRPFWMGKMERESRESREVQPPVFLSRSFPVRPFRRSTVVVRWSCKPAVPCSIHGVGYFLYGASGRARVVVQRRSGGATLPPLAAVRRRMTPWRFIFLVVCHATPAARHARHAHPAPQATHKQILIFSAAPFFCFLLHTQFSSQMVLVGTARTLFSLSPSRTLSLALALGLVSPAARFPSIVKKQVDSVSRHLSLSLLV